MVTTLGIQEKTLNFDVYSMTDEFAQYRERGLVPIFYDTCASGVCVPRATDIKHPVLISSSGVGAGGSVTITGYGEFDLLFPKVYFTTAGEVSFNYDRRSGVAAHFEKAMVMPTLKDKTLVGDSNMAALGYDIFTNAADRSRYLFNKDSNHYIPLYRRDNILIMWVFNTHSSLRESLAFLEDSGVAYAATFGELSETDLGTSTVPASSISASENVIEIDDTSLTFDLDATSSSPCVLSLHAPVTMDLLHQRCAHVGDKTLRLLKYCALGVPSFNSRDNTCFCPACAHAKAKRTTVPKATLTRAVAPYLTLFSDVMFHNTPSIIYGNTMSLLFICDFSRMSHRYYLKDKSGMTLARALDDLLRTVIVPFGYRVTLLSSDRAKEYIAGDFAKYCRDNNIAQSFSPSDRHELNGVAEKANRTHAEGTRALLIQSGRPSSFWQYAMAALIFMLNRLPHFANPGNISPWEMVTSQIPSVATWKVWGCPCYPLKLHQKWPTKARPAVLVGYADRGPGYKFLAEDLKTEFIGLDATFDEKFSQSTPLPDRRDFTDLFRYDGSDAHGPAGSVLDNSTESRRQGIGISYPDFRRPTRSGEGDGGVGRGRTLPRARQQSRSKKKSRVHFKDLAASEAGRAVTDTGGNPIGSADRGASKEMAASEAGRAVTDIDDSNPAGSAGRDASREMAVNDDDRTVTDVDDSQPAGSAHHDAPAQHPAGSADAYFAEEQSSGWKRPLVDSESDNEDENGNSFVNGISEERHNFEPQVEQDAPESESASSSTAFPTSTSARRPSLKGKAKYRRPTYARTLQFFMTITTALLARHYARVPLEAYYGDINEHELEKCQVFESAIEDEATLDAARKDAETREDTKTPDPAELDDVDEATCKSVALREAFASPEALCWKYAMQIEYYDLKRLGCWTVVRVPLDFPGNICTTKWILVKKYKNGVFERYKARLVVRGFSQVHGVDYFETYASVVASTTLRIFLTLVAVYDLELHKLDVKNAFIQADMEEDVYCWPPEGFAPQQPKNGFILYKLKRQWYGTKQAVRGWKTHLEKFLLHQQHFDRGSSDHSLYVKRGGGVILIMLAVVVDDVLVSFDKAHQRLYDDFFAAFQAYTEVAEQDPTSYIGFEIVRDRQRRTLTLYQTHKIKDLVKKHRFEQAQPEELPASKGLVLSVIDSPADGSPEQEAMKAYPYREIVGSCLYVAVMTRPDIAYTVNSLARFNNNPGKPHWNALRHLLRYLKGTADFGLKLGNLSDEICECYCDASWADNPDDRHSTSGYCVMIKGSLIAWWSRNSYLLSRSSFEAELVALYGATAELAWIRNLLLDFGVEPGTIPVHIDNETTIQQVNEHVITKRTRHIAIRFYSTTEYVHGKIIELIKVASEDNVADIFTKNLDARLFQNHRVRFLTQRKKQS